MGTPCKTHRNEEIIAAVEEGETYAVVAGAHGITRSRVHQICARAGKPSKRNKGLSETEAAYVVALFKAGVRPYQIELAGKGRTAAYKHLIEVGLHVPPTDTYTAWDGQQDYQIITRYYTDGSRAVAKDLQRTRNEIIGRANRLKKQGLLVCPWEKPLY